MKWETLRKSFRAPFSFASITSIIRAPVLRDEAELERETLHLFRKLNIADTHDEKLKIVTALHKIFLDIENASVPRHISLCNQIHRLLYRGFVLSFFRKVLVVAKVRKVVHLKSQHLNFIPSVIN